MASGTINTERRLNALDAAISGKIGFIDTYVTGAINTLDNGIYILEDSFPADMPANSKYICTSVKHATVFATENLTINKLFLYSFVAKPSATYQIRVFYYIP